MSIATEITRLQTAKANLKTSLEAKGATVSPDATLDSYPTILDDVPVALLQDKEVSVSGGTTVIEPDTGYTGMHSVTVTASGGPVEEKTVNFIDYEGTIVASYTGVEAQALTALPDAPDHSGDEVPLTFDEWNWTLAEIKSYNTSYPEAIIWVGANYHTTDGKIHLFYRIPDNDINGVAFTLQDTGTVDWGDGSAVESFPSSGANHVYSQAGRYHCTVERSASANKIVCGAGSASSTQTYLKLERLFLPTWVIHFSCRFVYWLQAVSMPSSLISFETCDSGIIGLAVPRGVTALYDSYHVYMESLRIVSLPPTLTTIQGYALRYNPSLKGITIPPNITVLNTKTFSGDNSLFNIVIPQGVTEIGQEAFSSCLSFSCIRIPSSVVSIGSGAFSGCYNMATVFVLATTPPTLASSGGFNASYQKHIYVPAESVEAYKADSNWSTLASIIEAIPS